MIGHSAQVSLSVCNEIIVGGFAHDLVLPMGKKGISMKKYLFVIFGVFALAACHNNDAADSCATNRAMAETPIYFELGSYVVRPEFTQQLDQGLIYIRGHRFKKIYLDGYADEIGPESYNVELSRKRVKAVRDYLVAHGVDDARIVADWHGVEHGRPYEKHRLVKVTFE